MPLAEDAATALFPLLSRRSVAVFDGPAPTDAEIDAILRVAVTVPDHGNLRPWRLVVVAGDARAAFGDALAGAAREQLPELPPENLDRVRAKAFVAPALIAVVARIDPTAKIPEWEQLVSAACAGYAITLAAHQLQLGAIWKSTPFPDGVALRAVLDMSANDRFLGWVNVGHLLDPRAPAPRPEIDLSPIVRHLGADGIPVPHGDSTP